VRSISSPCSGDCEAASRPVYERTGSLFAVIAIHAAFNTFATLSIAPLPAVVIGAFVVMGCVGAPRLAGRWPSPVPA
jgi:hypothetical protein